MVDLNLSIQGLLLLVLSLFTLSRSDNLADMYENIVPISKTQCVDKIRGLPLYNYLFRYDSVEGRKQFGPLADELVQMLPEAVEINPSVSFSMARGGKSERITIENYPIIDKNILFTYNIGAVQYLIEDITKFEEILESLKSDTKNHQQLLDTIESFLMKESSSKYNEQILLSKEEITQAKLQLDLEEAKNTKENERLKIEMEHQLLLSQEQDQLGEREIKVIIF